MREVLSLPFEDVTPPGTVGFGERLQDSGSFFGPTTEPCTSLPLRIRSAPLAPISRPRADAIAKARAVDAGMRCQAATVTGEYRPGS